MIISVICCSISIRQHAACRSNTAQHFVRCCFFLLSARTIFFYFYRAAGSRKQEVLCWYYVVAKQKIRPPPCFSKYWCLKFYGVKFLELLLGEYGAKLKQKLTIVIKQGNTLVAIAARYANDYYYYF